jgi:hypothetical protein
MQTIYVIIIIPAILLGCTTDFSAEDLDVDEDAPEDVQVDTHAEVPVDPETDAGEDPVEAEEPCGGPMDDCDGDGLAPLGGDCCDFDDRVHPGQDGWFSEPYYCPDESWDYNCSYEIEYEQEDLQDGIDAALPDGCEPYNMSTCNAAEGWMMGPVECGELEEYVDCSWYSTPYDSFCDTPDPIWSGVMRCR